MHDESAGSLSLQCPACGWSGAAEDFDQVRVAGTVLIHCPSCDANLGDRDHALAHAA
ncbi:MAG: hypothetical protein KDI51_13805 [Xanthomonadales bacterium]|nr:hypothetical protein [Xanthomonadales bacterium]